MKVRFQFNNKKALDAVDVNEKFELLLDALGAEKLLDELRGALSTDELDENLDYIAKNHSIEFEEDFAEDEEVDVEALKAEVKKLDEELSNLAKNEANKDKYIESANKRNDLVRKIMKARGK